MADQGVSRPLAGELGGQEGHTAKGIGGPIGGLFHCFPKYLVGISTH